MKRIGLISFTLFALMLLSTSNISVVADTIPVKVVTPQQSNVLTIATRHDSIIYTAFAEEFAKSSYGQSVGITDPSQVHFLTPTTFEAFYKAMTDPTFAVSLGWGGGPTLFNNLIAEGAVSPITDPTTVAAINDAVPDTLAGAEMKKFDDNGDMLWAANAISSFGFTVNHDVLEARNLTVPKTWEDLASPDFFTNLAQPNVGMGNAPDTTSNTRIYQIILQRYGWDRGWEIIYQMAANGKIYGGSVETRSSVIEGEVAAAMTIDFYGVIAMQENPRTEYIVPENASIVNGDPIAMAKNPANPDAANAFLQFLFSKEGQSIWLRDNINRLPIREDAFDTPIGQTRPDIHDLYNRTLSNQGIEFNESLALSLEEPMRSHFEATITDVHTKHRNTWNLMIQGLRSGNLTEEKFEELRKEFTKPAMTMEEAIAMNDQFLSDQSFQRDKKKEWRDFANSKLDSISNELGGQGISDTQVTNVPYPSVGFIFAFLNLVMAIFITRKRKN
ncbi:MAG: ABC transporter substrate-binding protein [Methanobacteriota archaeon]|nr:MAG: ABC transporter substrate-binding protein [Euryarchaeota archaeon]